MKTDVTLMFLLAALPLMRAQNESFNTVSVFEGDNKVRHYHLYGSPRAAYTWEEARELCDYDSSELAAIRDEDLQDLIVTNLTSELDNYWYRNRHVWTSGHVAIDKWTYVDGTEYSGDGLPDECGFLAPDGTLSGTVCNSRFQRVLCQYLPEQDASCFSGDIRWRTVCYRILESSSRFTQSWYTWYSGRHSCRSSPPWSAYRSVDQDLAYSNVDNPGLARAIRQKLGTSFSLWVGLTLRKHVWRQESETPMDYTNFNEMTAPSLGHVYLDVRYDSGSWLTKRAPATSNYFICEEVEELTGPDDYDDEDDEVTESTTPPVMTTTESLGHTRTLDAGQIAGIAVAVNLVVVAGAVVAAVFITRRKCMPQTTTDKTSAQPNHGTVTGSTQKNVSPVRHANRATRGDGRRPPATVPENIPYEDTSGFGKAHSNPDYSQELYMNDMAPRNQNQYVRPQRQSANEQDSRVGSIYEAVK